MGGAGEVGQWRNVNPQLTVFSDYSYWERGEGGEKRPCRLKEEAGFITSSGI